MESAVPNPTEPYFPVFTYYSIRGAGPLLGGYVRVPFTGLYFVPDVRAALALVRAAPDAHCYEHMADAPCTLYFDICAKAAGLGGTGSNTAAPH